MKKDNIIEIINYSKNIIDDVPVACGIVKDDKIISLCVNSRQTTKLISAHAEILAINQANKLLNSMYLTDCEMYVTLEPCPMCAWAIISSRLKAIYFGSYDYQYGALGGKINLANLINSDIKIYGGIEEEQCNLVLKNFFVRLRSKNIEKISG